MSDPESLSLVGGALCLDFANTLEFRRTAREEEALTSFEALRRWAARVGAIDGKTAALLCRSASDDPAAARRVLTDARLLREAIYNVLSAIAGGIAPRSAALEALNATLEPLLSVSHLGLDDGGVRLLWSGPPTALERVLWPVAWSTFELMLSDELSRLRECANQECHWLFIDRSRNRSRRWCDMAICGNVMKVRRFRQKQPPDHLSSSFSS
jgi:predicted RNA-binding Zn ribbon-like protein